MWSASHSPPNSTNNHPYAIIATADDQHHGKITPPQIEELPLWRVVCITSAMGGCFLGWGIQVGSGSSVLLDLGLSGSLTSTVWLFGPISGIIMAPLVGRYRHRL